MKNWPRHDEERPDPHDYGHYDPRHAISRNQPGPDDNQCDNDDCEGSEARSSGYGVRGPNEVDSVRQHPEKAESK